MTPRPSGVRPREASLPAKGRPQRRQQGAVLLEVVLALVLFVLAATIITGGLSAAVNEVRGLRLNTHAGNLAATILAEMQMGMVGVEASGPNNFSPPFDQWTWQTTVSPINEMVGATNSLQKVEVTVRHQSESVVCRLAQFVPVASNRGGADGQSGSGSSAPARDGSSP